MRELDKIKKQATVDNQELFEVLRHATTESEMQKRHAGKIEALRNVYLDKYDGTSDLVKHLAKYVTQVNLFSTKDAILCQIFSTSLKGLALHWYT
ncbi:hypothetical protein CR513_06649, partial [Mucuna pruriens]